MLEDNKWIIALVVIVALFLAVPLIAKVLKPEPEQPINLLHELETATPSELKGAEEVWNEAQAKLKQEQPDLFNGKAQQEWQQRIDATK